MHSPRMDTCLNCGGAILDMGQIYGFAGKICYCPKNPAHQWQRPASKEPPTFNTRETCMEHASEHVVGMIEEKELSRLYAQLAALIKETEQLHELLEYRNREAVAAAKNYDRINGLRNQANSDRDAARAENMKFREALEKIANMDYRGNRSLEMQIAHDALSSEREGKR